MPKSKSLYFIIGAIAFVVLGLVVAKTIFKEAVQPPVKALTPAEEVSTLVPAPAVTAPTVVKEERPRLEFQKGMTYVSWTRDGYSNANSVKSLEELVSLGVEWVSLVPTWFQESVDSCEIYPLNDKTPSDQSLLFAIEKLRELKIKIVLKPHLDLVVSQGKWRADIEFANPSEWQAWFASYTDFILHYARLAQQENIQMLCLGTELSRAAISQPALWRDLIKKVREVYRGQLTYAANWYEEFDYIEFWDALDYAGVDPYFPLDSSPRPTKEQISVAWKNWLKMLQDWQKKINKPVIFTEIGYKSSVGATEEPWKHYSSKEVDLQLQADCYAALLETFYNEPWFYGVYWWYWGVSPKMGGELHSGFTPQNKPAKEVIGQWYKKPVPSKTY